MNHIRFDSNSSRRDLLDTNAYGINSKIRQSDSSLEGQEAQHSGFISQSVKFASVAAVIPSAPTKPSGLRLPSPKIGFFDGVKSSVRTPRGGMQPHSVVPHGLPKHGAGSPSEAQHKPKLGKLQPVRSITSIDNKRPGNQQNLHQTHCPESVDVAIKTSSGKQSDEYTLHSERTHHSVNNQKIVHEDNQVDCLSRQVGLMDINSKTWEKTCQTDVSFKGKSNGLELSSHKELFDNPKNQELLKGSFTPCMSVSPTNFDMATSEKRRPFAAIDSICNMDCSDPAEKTVSEVKPTNLPMPESITTETS